MIIRVQDCQEVGYCMKSVRPWFVRHGLDFMDFVQNGIDDSKLRETDDAFADKLIAHVAKRDSENGL